MEFEILRLAKISYPGAFFWNAFSACQLKVTAAVQGKRVDTGGGDPLSE